MTHAEVAASVHPSAPEIAPSRRVAAEGFGTAFLLTAVVGSGIMAERLAGGNVALALLGNTLATGAALVVLISVLGPISGAHFNPAVTLYFALRREIRPVMAAAYFAAQMIGAAAGVLLAHAMFAMPLFELSTKLRDGPSQWLAEFIATFGLLGTIAGSIRFSPALTPALVGALHRGGVLVHRFHLVRQSGRDVGPESHGQLLRHRASLGACLHRGTIRRGAGGLCLPRMAIRPSPALTRSIYRLTCYL
jgi:hypothetical protein